MSFGGLRTRYDLEIPSNVHISDWLPQNDLLAHPNVKLFVTHAGNNGQHEALYHGVPMIAFPLFADQLYNALRIQHKGFGVQMDIKTFTSEEFVSNIRLVTSDFSYKAAISKASKMFKERPEEPWEKAAFWIEHVLEHGADHLRSYSETMPWYQFLMLDIAAFCGTVTVFVIFVMKKAGSCIWRICCSRKKRKRE